MHGEIFPPYVYIFLVSMVVQTYGNNILPYVWVGEIYTPMVKYHHTSTIFILTKDVSLACKHASSRCMRILFSQIPCIQAWNACTYGILVPMANRFHHACVICDHTPFVWNILACVYFHQAYVLQESAIHTLAWQYFKERRLASEACNDTRYICKHTHRNIYCSHICLQGFVASIHAWQILLRRVYESGALISIQDLSAEHSISRILLTTPERSSVILQNYPEYRAKLWIIPELCSSMQFSRNHEITLFFTKIRSQHAELP